MNTVDDILYEQGREVGYREGAKSERDKTRILLKKIDDANKVVLGGKGLKNIETIIRDLFANYSSIEKEWVQDNDMRRL